MFHVPTDDRWDAQSIAELLRHRHLDACTVDEAVRITLPLTLPHSLVGKLVWRLFRPSPLKITISHCPERFIRNVDLEYDVMKMSMDCPCFDDIAEAMRQRGYLAGNDRDIAARYVPGSAELAKLFDEIDELQIQKEDLVAKQDFENAVIVRDKEEEIRSAIDAMLFQLVSRTTDTENRDEP
ncbi:UvrB/UvrC motif-containing protein [Novipirellula sp. SH528]|uniref:UvrB/UvrC motif-containing protein n=1 Tax=Novipirellula sp. SH528 TaxID=3454466 RepID=UPI003FA17DC9